jgi:hypothetical protein
VSPQRLRPSKGGLTAEQKSAEGVVDREVGKASKELSPMPWRISCLRGRLLLDGDQFVAQLFGLLFDPCF